MNSSRARKPRNSVRPGQVWALGEHRLLCGSSLDPKLVERLVGKDKVDAIVSDPPYGVAYTEGKAGFAPVRMNKTIANDDISSEEGYAAFTKAWLGPALPHLARKNSVYAFGSDKMALAMRSGMVGAGITFSQLIIWVKDRAVIGRKDYLPQHELILFGWHGTHTFRRGKDKTVIFHPRPNKSALHPTMKPVGLVRRLILNSTTIGGVVYDGFGGSGTTLVACEQTKRRCLMAELDIDYCETIMRRYERLTNTKPKLL